MRYYPNEVIHRAIYLCSNCGVNQRGDQLVREGKHFAECGGCAHYSYLELSEMDGNPVSSQTKRNSIFCD